MCINTGLSTKTEGIVWNNNPVILEAYFRYAYRSTCPIDLRGMKNAETR